MKAKTAARLHKTIMAAVSAIGDQQASEGVELFPKLRQDGSLIPAGTRINWHKQLKRAAVDLWDTAENTPDAAPALWEDVAYRLGWRIIPETITSTLAFAQGECGWWKDVLYRSLMDGNTHTPDDAPEVWEVTEE